MFKILIIDDEEFITKTLRKLLEKEGYKVSVSNSGAAAVELIRQNFFNLIITDIKMPGMDGIETIRNVKEVLTEKKEENKAVIFITGYVDEEASKRAGELGCVSYIYKPFDLKVFLQKVKEALK